MQNLEPSPPAAAESSGAPEQSAFDVIVIGAGPAGSLAAYEVARAGRSCLLLERAEAPGQRVACGGGVMGHAGSGSGLLAGLPAKVVRRFECLFPAGTQVHETPVQKVLMIPRPRLDAHLAAQAVAAGATLCTRARVLGLDARTRTVQVQHAVTGQKRAYQGRFIVAADGPNTIARQAGVGFRGGRFSRAAALMVELDSPDDPLASAELVFRPELVPWGYFWVFPHGSCLNVGIGSLVEAHKESLRGALDRFIEQDPRLRGRKRLRSLGGILPLRPATRLYRDGLLVAGDAAGLVNPFTGAGIHHAMRSGQIAGRACAAALRRKSGRCFYGWRLGLSPTYLWLQALSLLAGFLLLLSKIFRRSPYVAVFRLMLADRGVIYRLASRIG